MALEGFTTLSDQVFVLDPTVDEDTKTDPDDPTTIMLFGWGDALAKHVAKFANGYRALYPKARIVLVLSPISKTMYSTVDQRAAFMLPAAKAATQPQIEGKQERLLIHVLSNTGGINLVGALNAYKTLMPETTGPLPHTLVVLDSTPGGYNFWSNVTRWGYAMSLGLSKFFPWPFVVTQALCVSMLGVDHFIKWIRGQESVAYHSCTAVNTPELSDLGASRVYLYSKEDKIIGWEDIEVHAAEAKSKGYDVSLKIFEGTPHVGHMRVYPTEYWNEIASAWKNAIEKDR